MHRYPPRPLVPSRIINGLSTLRLTSTFSALDNSIHSLKLSPDGDHLAIGNDKGRLEIRHLDDGKTWSTIGIYLTGAAIRTVIWHPIIPRTVFVGTANGYIHRITVVIGGVDVIFSHNVSEYIHIMAISPDGRQLVVGHGRSVSLINDPFPRKNDIGTFILVPLPPFHDNQGLVDYMIPVGIFFVDDNIFAVTLFGRCGICVFSRSEVSLVSTIALRGGSLVGSSALSPSGERIAVMNMNDGIDWYSLSHNNYISTSTYAVIPKQKLIVDLVFIDEDTVAVGNVDATICVATYGIPEVKLTCKLDKFSLVPLRTLTFGISRGKPIILGILPRMSPASGRVDNSLVGICLIESPLGMGVFPIVAANTANDLPLNFFHNLKIHGVYIPPMASIVAVALLATFLASGLFSNNRNLINGAPAVDIRPCPTEAIQAAQTITEKYTEQYTETFTETTFATITEPFSNHAVSTCICTLAGTMTVIDSPTSVI